MINPLLGGLANNARMGYGGGPKPEGNSAVSAVSRVLNTAKDSETRDSESWAEVVPFPSQAIGFLE